MDYFLAIDMGASSGRCVLASLQHGKLVLEEVHRFANGMIEREGHLCWDVDHLFAEILTGLRACAARGTLPTSMGIDTWGVDFVLLDADNRPVGLPVAYRDKRTEHSYETIDACIAPEALYRITGLQRQPFNTICQLVAIQQQNPDWLERAQKLLLMPDYFHFLLTDVTRCEYTNASTTQLLCAETKDWSWDVIEALGLPNRIFQELHMPGTYVGDLSPAVQAQIGFNCRVVLPPTHDTASAVVAVPSTTHEVLYISSGTWSLFGTELEKPLCTPQSQACNFTHEGGYAFRYRYLKNIMGLWMIQSVKKCFDDADAPYTYAQICDAAKTAEICSQVNCDDPRFFAPENMCEAIQAACRETQQQVPQTIGEFAAVVYASLAARYASAAQEIETLTQQNYPAIHLVGGGSKDEYLNALTASATGKTVWAGPTEATAIGNLLVQMIHAGIFPDLAAAKTCVLNSFPIQRFNPH